MKKIFVVVMVLLLTLIIGCGTVPSVETTVPSAEITVPSPGNIEEPLNVSWIMTTQESAWQDVGSLELVSGSPQKADLRINTANRKQEISGFGGAFNEKGWEALSVLSAEEKDSVLKAMFDPEEGAGFNICRVPIGANDYAISRYSLNETAGDFGMEQFSIERDKENLIPYIKAAMAHRPDLRVWASAWTPPTWMKTSGDFDGGSMKDDPQIYKAYALYLERFVEAYQAEGIDLFAVAVQNEPEIERHYPTCLWEAEQYAAFIRDHLGPLFEKNNVNAAIMLGTMSQGDFMRFPRLLSEPDINQYISIVGYQWEGLKSVALTRKFYADKLIYQTETECGNHYWEDGYNPDRAPNDWTYGIHTWNKVKAYFDEGVNAYMLWNMVLDEEGKSIDSENPWPQNAAITVDKHTQTVTYTPMFYAFKHFSYFVKPGAYYLETEGKLDAVAFLNPDGSLVIELQNKDDTIKDVTIDVDGATLSAQLPARSWSTFIAPAR